jgi:2-polyprenyl-6-methoxyphenol hydroxylase-like FAD-dependent oxidoreductase
LRHKTIAYDPAALWTTGPCSAVQRTLLQVVEGTTRLIGLLPIDSGRCSFFWGLNHAEKDAIWNGGLEDWKRRCVDFHPATEEVVDSIHDLEQLTFATYRHVSMPRVVDGRVVFIGDAAHATSPHLGQGVNLALADAVCLTEHWGPEADVPAVFTAYQQQRRATTRFYSRLTGWLTPFFQSNSRIRGWGRDATLPVLPHVPWVGRQMALAMAGLKTGWLSDSYRKPGP